MQIENIYNLILMCGGAFAILISMYLMFYPHNLYANRVLGSLVLVWSFIVISYALGSKEFVFRFPHIYGLASGMMLLFFPLVYLYIRTYLYRNRLTITSALLHYIPFLAYMIAFAPFYFQSAEAKTIILKAGVPRWFDIMQYIVSIIVIVQGMFYSIVSWRSLAHFQYFRKTKLSESQLSGVKWLKLFLTLNVILWIYGTASSVLIMIRFPLGFDPFKVFYFGLTLLIYLLAIFSINKPQLFGMEEDLSLSVTAKPHNTDHPEQEDKNGDYKVLMDYFNNRRPYLKADLKMIDVVEATGLNYKQIVQVFNSEFRKSFSDVVNEYRIKEVKRLLKEGRHKQHTLYHLAEESGFNSKTTFNRIFKKHTGQTPSDYIKTI
ncbi:helix-turn-helix domain-containing protein [Carboxylicivirga sp. RSCT41]|uniref:helix-turn-helix domain-containing protein n=1 Tax=Carboxylicivirga agarovorans TaxID=3417570 RepID=UPI003D342C76